ncbi:MAG TPA: membrane protein insertion efficiency factor YidD [Chitinophagales bacterium]|nr:membrane protein insertion efficiency factor YidD [Chitinophagales bacterium]
MRKTLTLFFTAICLHLLLAFALPAQNKQADITLLQAATLGAKPSPTSSGNHKKMLQTRSQSAFARYNPLALALTGSMYLYQNAISTQLNKQCLYGLSCSNFSKEAIREFGWVKGVFITADRLLRCNRISALDLNLITLNPKTGRFTDVPAQYRIKTGHAHH